MWDAGNYMTSTEDIFFSNCFMYFLQILIELTSLGKEYRSIL